MKRSKLKKIEIDLMSVAALLDGSCFIREGVEISIERNELKDLGPEDILDSIRDCMDFNNVNS